MWFQNCRNKNFTCQESNADTYFVKQMSEGYLSHRQVNVCTQTVIKNYAEIIYHV